MGEQQIRLDGQQDAGHEEQAHGRPIGVQHRRDEQDAHADQQQDGDFGRAEPRGPDQEVGLEDVRDGRGEHQRQRHVLCERRPVARAGLATEISDEYDSVTEQLAGRVAGQQRR